MCAEDLTRANNLPCMQRPIKGANLKNILVKCAGTYKKVPLHMQRRCKGGFSKHTNLTGKISSVHRKQTFQSGPHLSINSIAIKMVGT